MRDSVKGAYVGFTSRFEGEVDHMYLDIKGLVTTAIGCLIDSTADAIRLPWLHVDGSPATEDEIALEWHTVKSRQDLASHGGLAFRHITRLHLSPEGIAGAVKERLDANEAHLKDKYPEWEEWPADAQLGVLSMAWAMGPAFRFPHFEVAAKAQQWRMCAVECHMDDVGNPGLVPRNSANVILFRNAANIVNSGLPIDQLIYPSILMDPITIEGLPTGIA